MTNNNQQPNVVIIGGGPVGCWTALEIKQRDPAAHILIYERKAIYERDHILSVNSASLFQWSRNGKNPDFLQSLFEAQATCSIGAGLNGGHYAQPPERTFNLNKLNTSRLSLWWNLPGTLDIRAIDFERILKAECEKSGIIFKHESIETPEEVMEIHPDCTRFIAADGANSKMRAAIIGKPWKRDIFPSLDFNWSSDGQAAYLRINTFDKLGHVYAENIGLQKDGKSKVNVRFLVNDAEYKALPNATFKNPLTVTPDSPFWKDLAPVPFYGRTLKQDFYALRDLRAEHAREKPTKDPVTMTKIYLSQYCAKRFAKTINHQGKDRFWYMVGDAAMGMPFSRSVNSGVILGSQLASLLAIKWITDSRKPDTYNWFTRPWRIGREFAGVARTEARVHLYTRFFRPAMHAIAHTRAAPIVKGPTDYALNHLRFGKTS